MIAIDTADQMASSLPKHSLKINAKLNNFLSNCQAFMERLLVNLPHASRHQDIEQEVRC
jgi:hypothetical protein